MTGDVRMPYCGVAPVPADLWGRWNFDPVLLVALLVLLGLWLRFGRNDRNPLFFGAAYLGLILAFVSPLCALTSALFAARSLHHVLLVALVAPLMALAMPRRFGSGGIGAALAVSSVVLWVWHVPAAYEAALSSSLLYWALQLALLGSFVWFWHAVLRGEGHPVGALLAVGASAGQMGLLAAVLTLAPEPLYAAHFVAPFAWGLNALSDQQLGGLIMWVPAFFLYGLFSMTAARRAVRGVEA
ncbi:cytochrome c oxidase assembly protein [Phreatobacter sp. HK31-P]